MTDERPPATTTDAGIPAASDEYSLSVGPNGPLLLQADYLVQKMAQFNRERVPERVVREGWRHTASSRSPRTSRNVGASFGTWGEGAVVVDRPVHRLTRERS